MTKPAAATLATLFPEHWVSNLGIPTKVLTDNEPQFTSKCFVAICTQLGVKALKITEYHPQANGLVKRFNQTVVSSLRQYVAEHRKAYDAFVIPPTYAYNTEVRWATKLPLFSRVFTRKSPGPARICSPKTAGTWDDNSALSHRLWVSQEATLLRTLGNTNL